MIFFCRLLSGRNTILNTGLPKPSRRLLILSSSFRIFTSKAVSDGSTLTRFPENDEFIALLNSLLTENHLQSILEDYIGHRIGTTHIRLMNLLKTSMGVWNGDHPNRQVYCFCSRHWLKVGQNNNCLKTNFYHTVWHEFLHSVINPLSDQLFPGGITITEEQSTWYCALNESILWAITHRLCHQLGITSDQDNGWYFNNARRNKAPQAEEIYALLPQYEADRQIYSSIADFYPVLQAEFGNPPD